MLWLNPSTCSVFMASIGMQCEFATLSFSVTPFKQWYRTNIEKPYSSELWRISHLHPSEAEIMKHILSQSRSLAIGCEDWGVSAHLAVPFCEGNWRSWRTANHTGEICNVFHALHQLRLSLLLALVVSHGCPNWHWAKSMWVISPLIHVDIIW